MTQSLESVNAYSKAQSDLFMRRRKKRKCLNNHDWNDAVRAMFSGHPIIDIAIKHNISDKTVYKWRKNVIDGEIPPRYRMTHETRTIVNQSKIRFREDGIMKPWTPNKFSLSEDHKMATDESFLDRLRHLNAEETIKMAKDAGMSLSVDGEYLQLDAPSEPDSSLVERLKKHKPEIIKILKEQSVGIESLLSNLQQKAQEQTAVESSTLLQAPSGDRHLTEVNDAQLMMFLKGQGFTLYKISLDKI